MPRLPPPKLYLALVALAVVAGLVLWRVSSSRAARSVTLIDGRQLTIRQLTFGTQHKFAFGSLAAQLASPVLPAAWKTKVRLQRLVQQTESPGLVIWGEWRLSPKGGQPAPICVVLDELSNEKVSYSGRWMGVPANNRLIMAWILDNFPRRSASLRFQICDWGSNSQLKPVGTFTLPNPARQSYPAWKAPPRAAIFRTDGAEVSMANFSRGSYITDPWLTVDPHARLATGYVATFHVKQNGRFDGNWKIEGMTVSDATGNRAESRLQPSIAVGDYLVFGLNETLWPGEEAWKLRTRFTRTGGFGSNELCTIRGVPIPRSNEATQIITGVTANEVSIVGLELQFFGGAAFFRMRQDIEVEPLLPQTYSNRVVTLAEVKDDQGRNLRHDRSHYHLEDLHFGIELLPDSQWLDLTFAVQTPVIAEFLMGLSPGTASVPKP